jgi:cytochrome c-type biogenesis protein CcmH
MIALWLILAMMTAAAVFAVLWPLARKSVAARGGSDRLVYQDQLREVTRDREAGLIGQAEAESARVEISRRLLAAAEAEAAHPAANAPVQASRYRRAAAIAAIIIVPATAIGFYVSLGSPDIPGQSAFARAADPHEGQSIEDLVSKVETRLARNPNDGAGWELIAPVYMRLGRYSDAVNARRRSIALNGDTPARESDLGEALVAAADGVVTDDAKQIFLHAVAGDPGDPQARYFLGLADDQDGNRDAAANKWRALLASAPSGAPWADFVRKELARVSGQDASTQPAADQPAAGGGPSSSDVAAAQNMDPEQRSAMIRSMVQRLADRLHGDGGDVEGWLRLVRAYAVLGDRDKAKNAAADARRALQDHPDQVKEIDGLVKDLGLQG